MRDARDPEAVGYALIRLKNVEVRRQRGLIAEGKRKKPIAVKITKIADMLDGEDIPNYGEDRR